MKSRLYQGVTRLDGADLLFGWKEHPQGKDLIRGRGCGRGPGGRGRVGVASGAAREGKQRETF